LAELNNTQTQAARTRNHASRSVGLGQAD